MEQEKGNGVVACATTDNIPVTPTTATATATATATGTVTPSLERDEEMQDVVVATSLGNTLKAPKLKSDVWIHFDKKGYNIAKCKNDKKIMSADSSKNGTSSLRSHVKRCKENPSNKIESKQQTLTFKTVDGGKEGVLSAWI